MSFISPFFSENAPYKFSLRLKKLNAIFCLGAKSKKELILGRVINCTQKDYAELGQVTNSRENPRSKYNSAPYIFNLRKKKWYATNIGMLFMYICRITQ